MTPANSIPDLSIALWRMEFRDPATEIAFRKSEWSERSKHNTIAAATASLVAGASLFLISRERDPSASFALAIEIAAGMVLLVASRVPKYDPKYEWATAASVVVGIGAGVGLIFTSPGPDASMAAFVVVPLILAAGFNFISIVFWMGIGIAIIGFFSVVLNRLELNDIVELLRLQMILTGGLAIVIHRLINSSRRADFQERIHREHEAIRLETARREAEAANAAKSRFLAGISHEIRTPMNGVLAMSEILIERAGEEVRRDLEIIRDASQGLLRLLNDLVDLSAAESGGLRLALTPFRLRDLAAQSAEVIRVKSEAKGLALQISVDPACPEWVMGDGARLRQVLINLLANAAKFTNEGSIRLTLTREELGIRFEVADTGPGIAESDLPLIFDRFFRGTGRESGAGLGLSICREILELMGSELKVKSEGGARFWFVVDLTPCESGSEPPQPTLVADTDASILIVEDSRMNRYVIVEMLKSLGFKNIETVEDGVGVPERFAEFDIVLLDLSLPGEDGWSIAAKLMSKGEARPRIVAVSAFALAADQARSTMDDFVAKPVEKRELVRALNRWVPKRNTLDRAAALEQMGADPEVLQQALAFAAEEFPILLRELREQEPGSPRFREIMHRFVGSLSTVHAEAALWRAERLQALSRADADCGPALRNFEMALEEFLSALVGTQSSESLRGSQMLRTDSD